MAIGISRPATRCLALLAKHFADRQLRVHPVQAWLLAGCRGGGQPGRRPARPRGAGGGPPVSRALARRLAGGGLWRGRMMMVPDD